MADALRKIVRKLLGPQDVNGISRWPEWQALLGTSPYRHSPSLQFAAAGLTAFGVGPLSLPIMTGFAGDFHALFKLLKAMPERFRLDREQLLYQDGTITLAITDCDACYVIEELLLDQLYRFRLPEGAPLVMADVGMNIGLSCLYFAARPEVERVYGFEPFTTTYQQAVHNQKLNPALAKKISPINRGWEAAARTVPVPIQSDRTLINSTSDFFLNQRGVRADAYTEVSVDDAAAALATIAQAHPACRLGLKLDCEGAEYGIIRRLAETGWLPKISLILLEWHYQGTQELEDILTAAGFSLMALTNPAMREVGMLYAFRGA